MCPFNPDHSRREAFVGRREKDGAIVAGCQHESCTWDWAELKEKFLPKEQEEEPPEEPPPSTAQTKPKKTTRGGAVDAVEVAKILADECPMLLTLDKRVALYRGGVYRPDDEVLMGAVVHALGKSYRPGHLTTIRQVITGTLAWDGLYLPERLDRPLVNVRNGLVDLETGQCLDHDPDPDVATSVQLPVTYDPDAGCPTFDAWAEEIIGDQLPALLEISSGMLDPTMTPPRALLLYGPSRSGKSTYLRLLQAIAGKENTSAVTLHQLADDRFAAARVYRKILNAAADLSAGHIEDISIFKMLTGEDLVRGNPKYGKDFEFTNRALFAFSANELPTVGESSRAYSERMKPFRFGYSFAGREDNTIEGRMRAELPGIFNLLVRAWQARRVRRQDLDEDPTVRKEFEAASDRVQQWLDEDMTIVRTVSAGQEVSADGSTPTYLHSIFATWAKDNGHHGMGRNKLTSRLTSKDDVVWIRLGANRQKALNIRRRKTDDPPDSSDGFGPPQLSSPLVIQEQEEEVSKGEQKPSEASKTVQPGGAPPAYQDGDPWEETGS